MKIRRFRGFPVYQQVVEIGFEPFFHSGSRATKVNNQARKTRIFAEKHLQDAVVADQDSPVFFISSYEPIIWRFFPLRQGGIGSGVPFCRF